MLLVCLTAGWCPGQILEPTCAINSALDALLQTQARFCSAAVCTLFFVALHATDHIPQLLDIMLP